MPIERRAFVVATLLAAASTSTRAVAAAAGRPDPWLAQDISFRSPDGVRLSGSLVTPRHGKPTAAIVLGPGSSPGERYLNLAALVALRGIAVLTYDKRGSGRSGGPGGDPRDIGADRLALMASDAAAAMRWIARDARTKSLPRGFVAISQSGWVFPLALAEAPHVDFLGFWSGPACTTSEQLHFQHFSEARGYDRSRMTDAEIAQVMQQVVYRPDDVDPLKPLKDVAIPALWLFGGQDPWVPIDLSTRRLQRLIDGGRSNFAYRVFPGEAHNLADASDQPSFVAMVGWIKEVADSRSASSDPTMRRAPT